MSDSRFKPGTVKGKLSDGHSAGSWAVTVQVFPDEVQVRSTENQELYAQWSTQDLKIEFLPGSAIKLTHPSNPSVQVLVEEQTELFSQENNLKKEVKKVPLYVLFTVLIVSGIYLCLPFVSAFIANQVPIETEEKLQGKIFEYFQKKDQCTSKEIEEVFTKIRTRLQIDPKHFKIMIIKMNLTNAFALPGGVVVLTDKLIKEAESAEEVIGVLGHEIAHVQKRHLMKRIVRQGILTGIWSLTMGDFSGLMVIDPDTAYQIASLQFSRDEETEADELSTQILRDANVDIGGFARFFERLDNVNRPFGEVKALDLLSTHPNTKERIAKLNKIAAAQGKTEPVLNEKEWKVLQDACKSKKDKNQE